MLSIGFKQSRWMQTCLGCSLGWESTTQVQEKFFLHNYKWYKGFWDSKGAVKKSNTMLLRLEVYYNGWDTRQDMIRNGSIRKKVR